MTSPTSRRTVLTAALAAAAGAGTVASATPATAAASSSAGSAAAPKALVDNRFWHTYTDWRCGTGDGARVLPGTRPGLVIATPAGRTDHTDPHTGTTAAWDYATWT
ncbi:peptidase C39 family protein, partial [Streptomyces sp. ID01-9D]|nr:peptidase C39 family protein [Streptomyces sp. ID01-9D]